MSSFFADKLQPVSLDSPGESGYFSSPGTTLDPRLFGTSNGEKVRPEVRNWIINTLYGYWGPKYNAPRDWSRVWIAGSGISYQWQASRGNGDLDILIGVDFGKFFAANPRFRGLTPDDMGEVFNQEFHAELWPKTALVQIGTSGCPVPLPESVPGATMQPSSAAVSASRVSGSTSASAISHASTGSPSNSTQNFWKNKATGVPSVTPIGPVDDMGFMSSTTTTNLAQFEGSSALPATTPLEFSETPLTASSEPSITSGVFEVTFYCNPQSADIRGINPYAAYNLTKDEWTVRPPQGADFDHPQKYYKAAEREAALARTLATTFNANVGTPSGGLVAAQAAALYDDIHLGRKQAFQAGGSGYGDYYNFRWQYHKQQGTAQLLHSIGEQYTASLAAHDAALYGGPIDSAEVSLRRAALWNRGGNGR